MTILITATIAGLVGLAAGFALRRLILLSQRSTLELELKEKRLKAKEEAAEVKKQAEKEAAKITKSAQREAGRLRQDLAAEKSGVTEAQTNLTTERNRLEEDKAVLKSRKEQLEEAKSKLAKRHTELELELAEVAGISKSEARRILLTELREQHADDLAIRRKKLETYNKESLEERAREILASVLQRLSRSVDPEILSTKVTLSNDDLKGKIIGKEGRNIRAFQQATGVEVIIDETPETVTISSYDPIRRAIAKYALDLLLEDGRVQPARIEQFVADAKEKVNRITKERGEAAAQELGLMSLDSRIIAILGRLHFRTSYGQNVLEHSIEAAHIAQMLAYELGADPQIAKAGALVHDIGKAVDHELSGSHVDIGIHILTKFSADEKVISAMKSHHDDCPHASLEAVIVQVADSVSGARPGARKQSIESYISRLQELEKIADEIEGVVNSYAIEAGREVRVFVNSSQVNESQAYQIARQIATQIESRVSYPGEVKVHVIRETRLTHYAR
ncbi:MAG: ribonuclease Y [Candidatus Paceibacterota bacterium]